MSKDQPWSGSDATIIIRELAISLDMDLSVTRHALDRMGERSLIMSDVLYALKSGFVREDPVKSTLNGFYRYGMEAKTPNSGNREIKLICIPDPMGCQIKLVSVMWIDEVETRAGTLTGE